MTATNKLYLLTTHKTLLKLFGETSPVPPGFFGQHPPPEGVGAPSLVRPSFHNWTANLVVALESDCMVFAQLVFSKFHEDRYGIESSNSNI